jgi:hypothetical protein
MLNILFDDIFFMISTYLNNKDSFNYINCSKYLKDLFLQKGYGYIKSLKIKNKINDIEKFYFIFSEHLNSVNKIEFHSVINPQNFIFSKWPKTVIFNNCTFTDTIDPYLTDTEILIITNYNILKINWKKFQKLKKIILKSKNKLNNDENKKYIQYIKYNCKDIKDIIIDQNEK